MLDTHWSEGLERSQKFKSDLALRLIIGWSIFIVRGRPNDLPSELRHLSSVSIGFNTWVPLGASCSSLLRIIFQGVSIFLYYSHTSIIRSRDSVALWNSIPFLYWILSYSVPLFLHCMYLYTFEYRRDENIRLPTGSDVQSREAGAVPPIEEDGDPEGTKRKLNARSVGEHSESGGIDVGTTLRTTARLSI